MSPTNGSAAPVCPISRSQVAPGMPGAHVPQIPKATDLPSAIAAINQLNIILQTIGVGPPTINNIRQPSPPPSGGSSPTSDGGSSSTKDPFRQNWVQVSRSKTLVRILNPNDRTQWVDVERIERVRWDDQFGNFLVYTGA
jgi:hypothetical protein